MNISNFSYIPQSQQIVDTKELIQQYCSVIDQRIIILISIIGIIWLMQPWVYKKIDQIEFKNNLVKELFGSNSLKIMYKWIGLGLLFMVGYLIKVMG